MVRFNVCLQLLLLLLIPKPSDAISDQCSELEEDISSLKLQIIKTKELKKKNEERADSCEVSFYNIAHV
jgi:hypothetical protein